MAVTQTELKSSFLKDIVEEEKYKANIKSIQDWLTSRTQAAASVYQTQEQTAAQQASYDISGAYANYLRQQRAIRAQGNLEIGYKEELEDLLTQDYASAYAQAKDTESQNVASAQASYLKNIQTYQETASKAATSYYESALKEAELKANIYKAAEEYANLEGSQFNFYNIDPATGKHTLSEWGYEQLSRALLGEEGGFKSYLEEQKLTDELEYYLADPTGTHERLFGITETAYDPMSQEAIARRIRTEGYVESIAKPTFNDKDSIEADFADMTAQLTTYASQLGLTDEDISVVLEGSTIKDFVNEFGIDEDDYQDQLDRVTESLQLYADYKYGLSDEFVTRGRYDWAIAKNGGGGRGSSSTHRGGFTTH